MSTEKIAKIFGIIILAAIIAATLAVMVFERYIVQRSQYEIPVLSDHGRVRRDLVDEDAITLWCCGDQIRKGAAANAVQILRLLAEGKK